MTNREFFTAISKMETASAEIRAFATESIAKLDKRNDARKDKPTKAQLANEPIKDAIANALTETPITTADLAVKVGASAQKVSALVRQLVADGKARAFDVKVKGKGACKAYAVAETETDAE